MLSDCVVSAIFIRIFISSSPSGILDQKPNYKFNQRWTSIVHCKERCQKRIRSTSPVKTKKPADVKILKD